MEDRHIHTSIWTSQRRFLTRRSLRLPETPQASSQVHSSQIAFGECRLAANCPSAVIDRISIRRTPYGVRPNVGLVREREAV